MLTKLTAQAAQRTAIVTAGTAGTPYWTAPAQIEMKPWLQYTCERGTLAGVVSAAGRTADRHNPWLPWCSPENTWTQSACTGNELPALPMCCRYWWYVMWHQAPALDDVMTESSPSTPAVLRHGTSATSKHARIHNVQNIAFYTESHQKKQANFFWWLASRKCGPISLIPSLLHVVIA